MYQSSEMCSINWAPQVVCEKEKERHFCWSNCASENGSKVLETASKGKEM